MKKTFFTGCLAAFMGLGMGLSACSSDADEVTPDNEAPQEVSVGKMVFRVDDFPSMANDASSRGYSEEDEDCLKWKWEEGDVIYIVCADESDPGNQEIKYKLKYNGETEAWDFDEDQSGTWETEATYTAIYAPAYMVELGQGLRRDSDNHQLGQDEYLTATLGQPEDRDELDTYVVNIHFERPYSRLRIKAHGSNPLDVIFSKGITSPEGEAFSSLHELKPDGNGNYLVYGIIPAGILVWTSPSAVGSKDGAFYHSGEQQTKVFPSDGVKTNWSYLFNYTEEVVMVLDLDKAKEDSKNVKTEIRDAVGRGYTDWKVVNTGDTETSFKEEYFRGGNVTSLDLSESKLTEINAWFFQHCENLKTIKLPEELTTIGADAFSDCSSLKEITLPFQITCIGGEIFNGCMGLKRVNIYCPLEGEDVSVGSNNFLRAYVEDVYCYVKGTPGDNLVNFLSQVSNDPVLHVWSVTDYTNTSSIRTALGNYGGIEMITESSAE